MNWLERARLEIRKSASRPTANTAERNPTAVMAVLDTAFLPNLRACQAIGVAPEDLLSRAMLEEFEERAAIMEFDGGLSRRDAEREAYLAVISGYRLHCGRRAIKWALQSGRRSRASGRKLNQMKPHARQKRQTQGISSSPTHRSSRSL